MKLTQFEYSKLLGFPPRACVRFKVGDRTYRLGKDSELTIQYLVAIRKASESTGWAVKSRSLVRKIERLNCSAILSYVVLRTEDPMVRILAIWLRGRLRGTIGGPILGAFVISDDFTTRKELARALQRIAGWKFLEAMARKDPEPRIRRLATSRKRSMGESMTRFKRNVDHRPVARKYRPLWILPEAEFRLTPPKSLQMIREILERIRRLVGQTDRAN